MNPHLLEAQHRRLGSPAWFWPVVLAVLFIGLPLLAGALEAAL